ncbi:MAG TPA: glycosyltransferase family 39 protein [Candidatus Acidoferrum sp.]|nr:glycosyltransferase family 39 protein [Candidatus Acidoferrum sp.]
MSTIESNEYNISLKILFITPFIGYLLLVYPLLNQLPMHEEVVHVIDTDSWKVAIEYWWHPPLYVLLVRLFRSIFGDSYKVIYSVGIIAALFNIYFVKIIIETLLQAFDTSKRTKYMLIGMWSFVLMPITVSGSILLEMEPAVLTPLCLLAIWYYLKNENKTDSLKFKCVVGLLFGLTMWAKIFATPFLLIGAIFIHEWRSGNSIRKAAKDFSVILFSALLLFVPTYMTYAYLFLHGKNTISFIFSDKISADAPLYASGKILIPIASKLIAWSFWFSPYFIILMCYLTYRMFGNITTFRKELFLVIAIISILLFYLVMSPYLFLESKYFYPIFPLIAILFSSILAREELTFPIVKYAYIIPVVAIGQFLLIGDPLFKNLFLFRNNLIHKLIVYNINYLIFNIILFLVVLFVLKNVIPTHHKLVCISLILLSISSSLSLFANQAIGQYQTKYQYGETGASETIEYIKRSISSQNNVILPFDIKYYAGIKYMNESSKITDLEDNVFQWDWIIERHVNILKIPSQYLTDYSLVKKFGSYEILKHK